MKPGFYRPSREIRRTAKVPSKRRYKIGDRVKIIRARQQSARGKIGTIIGSYKTYDPRWGSDDQPHYFYEVKVGKQVYKLRTGMYKEYRLKKVRGHSSYYRRKGRMESLVDRIVSGKVL